MTPGGVQSLIKGHGVLAGNKVVVAGSGPFLLPVAAGIIKAGGQVVELLEANKSWRWLLSPLTLLENITKLNEAFYYIKTISQGKVRANEVSAVKPHPIAATSHLTFRVFFTLKFRLMVATSTDSNFPSTPL